MVFGRVAERSSIRRSIRTRIQSRLVFAQARIGPDAAFYSDELHEFILPYDAVRQATSPDQMLLDFLQTTYVAAADLGNWDRASLERDDAAIPELARRGT